MTRGNGHKLKQEVPSEHQGTLFHCKGNLALSRVAQGGCADSVLGDTQKMLGHSPGQPGLGATA